MNAASSAELVFNRRRSSSPDVLVVDAWREAYELEPAAPLVDELEALRAAWFNLHGGSITTSDEQLSEIDCLALTFARHLARSP